MVFESVFHNCGAQTENAQSQKTWLQVGMESKNSEDDLSVSVYKRGEINSMR